MRYREGVDTFEFVRSTASHRPRSSRVNDGEYLYRAAAACARDNFAHLLNGAVASRGQRLTAVCRGP